MAKSKTNKKYSGRNRIEQTTRQLEQAGEYELRDEIVTIADGTLTIGARVTQKGARKLALDVLEEIQNSRTTDDVTATPHDVTIPSLEIASIPQAIENLQEFERATDVLLERARADFSQRIRQLAGKSATSLVTNQKLAAIIQSTAKKLGLAFLCPSCGRPARLKCSPNVSHAEGSFSFAHTKTTHVAAPTLPELVTTIAPDHPRKRGLPRQPT